MWVQMAINQMTLIQLSSSMMACHRIPDRCFKFRDKSMPMCARCLGASIGHVAAFYLFIFKLLPSFYISLLFMAIIFIDWALQFFHILPSTNYRRLFTGVLGGVGVGSCLWFLFGLSFSVVRHYFV